MQLLGEDLLEDVYIAFANFSALTTYASSLEYSSL